MDSNSRRAYTVLASAVTVGAAWLALQVPAVGGWLALGIALLGAFLIANWYRTAVPMPASQPARLERDSVNVGGFDVRWATTDAAESGSDSRARARDAA